MKVSLAPSCQYLRDFSRCCFNRGSVQQLSARRQRQRRRRRQRQLINTPGLDPSVQLCRGLDRNA
ncbi:hypothetical protein INR49_004153 [Caranx melampygus]|nr:hypothetical protein INR49_004153 [Caranx melampygus]